MAGRTKVHLSRDVLDVVVFDLDGVLTDTAAIHMAAWKETFDAFLAGRDPATGEDLRPFTPADYEAHVDGRPRYDGARTFLASRGISLPEDAVVGLGDAKNVHYQARIAAEGIPLDPAAVPLLGSLRGCGFRTGVVTSSRNGRPIVDAAGLSPLIDVLLDGTDLATRGLPGKPAPDLFLAAADRLGGTPDRTAVFEDAVSGVEAGRRGHFFLVVGVDRTGHGAGLRRHGATFVIPDLAAVEVGPALASHLPSALEPAAVAAVVEGPRVPPAVFLDYDGTLTPIVRRPELAVLDGAVRAAVARLASCCPVAVISGRDRPDVEAMVGVPGLVYAGSHGFDIRGPGGAVENRIGEEHRPELEAARDAIAAAIQGVPGAWIEPKRHSFAVHYRETPPGRVGEVAGAVQAAVARHPRLRTTEGKRVFEVQPRLDWDKGKAVLWLLQALGLEGRRPVYVGDDLTDEDAFRAVRDRGIGILVRDGDRPTWAHYTVRDAGEVRRLLEAWAGRLGVAT